MISRIFSQDLLLGSICIVIPPRIQDLAVTLFCLCPKGKFEQWKHLDTNDFKLAQAGKPKVILNKVNLQFCSNMAEETIWSFGYGSNMDVKALEAKKHVKVIGKYKYLSSSSRSFFIINSKAANIIFN